jgi:molybdopterin molybdotransferase
MISLDQAAAIVASVAHPIGSETIKLDKAAGRVLASDVVARVDSPRRNVSAMDGYAVREADLYEGALKLVGISAPGQAELPIVGPGECVRIFTGGAVPPGADRVVVQEIVRRDGDFAILEQAPGAARHIRTKGSDFESGERLLLSSTLLGPQALVAAAAADVSTLEVYRRPQVTIVATGDELAEPGTALERPGSIPESVSFGVASLCESWGGVCLGRRSLGDDLAKLEAIAVELLPTTDLLVVTGGASVGEKDFGKSMFEAVGLEIYFSKVAIKPGKPVWLGRAQDKLVLGLPGNPTSALVTARLFLAPLIAGISGQRQASALRWKRARLFSPIAPCGERETFLRARWSNDSVEVLGFEDSGAQQVLAKAELLVRQSANSPALDAGDEVLVLDL